MPCAAPASRPRATGCGSRSRACGRASPRSPRAIRSPTSARPRTWSRWLADTTEVPQNRLAALLGVSMRQFQRWLSTQGAQPEGDDARRARAVARIVNQLRFSLTPAGAVEWFGWPRDDLGGRRPADLLDQAERLPELAAIAGSMRSTYATDAPRDRLPARDVRHAAAHRARAPSGPLPRRGPGRRRRSTSASTRSARSPSSCAATAYGGRSRSGTCVRGRGRCG